MADAHDTFLILADTLLRAGVKDQAVLTLEPSDYVALLHLAMDEAKPCDDLMQQTVVGFRSHFELCGIRVKPKHPISAYHREVL